MVLPVDTGKWQVQSDEKPVNMEAFVLSDEPPVRASVSESQPVFFVGKNTGNLMVYSAPARRGRLKLSTNRLSRIPVQGQPRRIN